MLTESSAQFLTSFESFVRKWTTESPEEDDTLVQDILEGSLREGFSVSSQEENQQAPTGATCTRLGIQKIPFGRIKTPNGQYEQFRLRNVTESRVVELSATLKARASPILTSLLTVMKDSDNFILLDGNHRYEAMLRLRKNNRALYETIECQVFDFMSPQEAIGIAFASNTDSEDALKMTDQERVLAIRRVATQTLEEDKNREIYKLFGVSDVSK